MNIIIDDLPYEYEGYLINYNFRTGILISECLIDGEFEDNEDGEEERIWTSLRILYGKGVPPTDIALKGLSWFLNCGDVQCNKEQEVSELLFSFFEDRNRIYSAFMMKYGINLNKSNMHFFEFLPLFNDLDKTAFRRIVDLRRMTSKEIKRYSKEDQETIRKMKQEFALKNKYKNKVQDRMTKFDKILQEATNAK